MVDSLIKEGVIKSDKVRQAFLKVPREEFVWHDTKSSAYIDTPLPLGDTKQTISAPHMVAIMLEKLEIYPGLKILEVGTGSGYNAALMASILVNSNLEERGHITTVERIHELVEFSTRNLERTGYGDTVTVIQSDGTLGFPERSKEEIYDRVVVTAAASNLPKYLKIQLKKNGILLVPKGDWFFQELIKAIKTKDGTFYHEKLCGCMFVPLIGVDGQV